MHQLYRMKMEEAREELEKCDPHIISVLARAGSMIGKALMTKGITWQQENEEMSKIDHLSVEFRSKCVCQKKK